MLVVDASVLFEVVADTRESEGLREHLTADTDHAAPHLVDAEVLSVIQSHSRVGNLDPTAASQAIDDLRSWPGQRWPHRSLLERAWELRHNVRSYDGLYVALAEALDGTLITLDQRLSKVRGLKCDVTLPSA